MTKEKVDFDQMSCAIQLACAHKVGVIDHSFLCQSLSVLEPKKPLTLPPTATVAQALAVLREHKTGCVLITDTSGALVGIFSERDCVLKISGDFAAQSQRPLAEVMTKEPITQPIDGTIAFALSLMSQGGFRHIPIVDDQQHPVGIISVKDVVDYIVTRFMDDVMSFPVAGV